MFHTRTNALVLRLRRAGALAVLCGACFWLAALPAASQLPVRLPTENSEPLSGPIASSSPAATARVEKEGWWYRFQGPQQGEPANPLRPLIPIPAPSSVPPNSLGVGAEAGQQDKVAAIGILVSAASVEKLTLTLKESTANGARLNENQAPVAACPITTFWGPPSARPGNWIDRPGADCNVTSAAGLRGADGTWTFDLTDIAKLWTASSGGLTQNGVLLQITGTMPGPFQVSFVDSSQGGVSLDIVGADLTTSGDESPPTVPEDTAAPTEVLGDTTESAGEIPSTSPPEVPPTDLVLARPSVAQGGRGVIPPGGGWSWFTILLVPVVAGVALVVSYVLGPAGEPSLALHREGSVSKSLEQHGVSASAFRRGSS